jgi:hypothetical protein
MNKFFKFFFGLFALGSFSETISIMKNPQYANMQWDLVPMAVGFTLLFGYLAVRFHYKDKNGKEKLKL